VAYAAYLAPEVTQALLAAGARADQPLGDGRTALFYAACHGNSGVVKLLLAAGADPNVRSGRRLGVGTIDPNCCIQ
jgi:ankyrin repeat protein